MASLASPASPRMLPLLSRALKAALIRVKCLRAAFVSLMVTLSVAVPSAAAASLLAEVTQTHGDLREIKVEEGATVVPPEARGLITRLKHQLRDYVRDTLNDPSSQFDRPELLESFLRTQLKEAGVSAEPATDYSGLSELSIRRPDGQPNLLALEITIEIPYGADSSLYLFRQVASEWRLVLASEATGYEQLNGARAEFRFHVSKPIGGGGVFIAGHIRSDRQIEG